MARLQPWRNVISPREDLRQGKPLDASEFAVHLDKVRLGTAPPDYSKPERFFERTYLTKALTDLGAETVRRLSGEVTETSAVFNMATQFGGGKTHALALLLHLANGGPKANQWRDVSKILSKAGVASVPKDCAKAVFVGTAFDSIVGRGGQDGTPLRRTPWGEIAFQLGGAEAFSLVAIHDEQFTEPKGDVIEAFLPKDRPCLILMDEIINYVSTYRDRGYHNKLYNFVQSLSEAVLSRNNAVLVVSIPASELSYTDSDEADQQRFKNMLDRVGKAILVSVGTETSEIIRRRLFEWDDQSLSSNGRVLLPKEAQAACREYSRWVGEHRQQIPQWFPVDQAQAVFESTYPFHPTVLSVFERKWQGMPRFQQTRGILRLLALWVSHAYSQSYKGAQKDPIIGLGSAPLEDPKFRTALLEQLGEPRLEGVVTTDICGKKDSHAARVDAGAEDTIKRSQLHKKVATAIFFESNGGQMKNQASIPEIRLAVSDPELDIGNVETVLDELYGACYYLEAKGNQYRFTLKENLNKRFADRSAGVKNERIEERLREEIEKVFPSMEGVERVFYPEKSAQILDRPVVTLVIAGPHESLSDIPDLHKKIDSMTREHGQSSRSYKSALLWVVPETDASMRAEARKLIAWEDIKDEGLELDDIQRAQLDKSLKRAARDFRESIWRSYKNLVLLGRDNKLRTIDMGLPTSSSAESMTAFIVAELRRTNDIEKDISARFLVKHWAEAFTEWSTKDVRDAFYASPLYPRLLNQSAVKEAIARGVCEHVLAYVGKAPDGSYSPFCYKMSLAADEVDISEDMFIIKAEIAEKHIEPPRLTAVTVTPSQVQLKPGTKQAFTARGLDQHGHEMDPKNVTWTATGGKIGSDGVFVAGPDVGGFNVMAKSGDVSGSAAVTVSKEPKPIPPEPPQPPGRSKRLDWSGDIPPQKWMNFYTSVLTKLVQSGQIKLEVSIEASPKEGLTEQQVEEIKSALRGLGLEDDVRTD